MCVHAIAGEADANEFAHEMIALDIVTETTKQVPRLAQRVFGITPDLLLTVWSPIIGSRGDVRIAQRPGNPVQSEAKRGLLHVEPRQVLFNACLIAQRDMLVQLKCDGTDEIGSRTVEAGSFYETIVAGDMETLAETGPEEATIGCQPRITQARIGADATLDPVKAGEAIAQKEVGCVEVEGNRILIGDISGLRFIGRGDELENRCQHISRIAVSADQRPAQVETGRRQQIALRVAAARGARHVFGGDHVTAQLGERRDDNPGVTGHLPPPAKSTGHMVLIGPQDHALSRGVDGGLTIQGIGVEVEGQFSSHQRIGKNVIGRHKGQGRRHLVLIFGVFGGAVVEKLRLGEVAAGKTRQMDFVGDHAAVVNIIVLEERPVAPDCPVPAPFPGVVQLEIAGAAERAARWTIVARRVTGHKFIDASGLELVNTAGQAVAPLGFQQRPLLRCNRRHQCQILVRRQCPEVRRRHADAIVTRPERRQQEATAALHARIRIGKSRRPEHWNAADLEGCILVVDRVFLHVVFCLARHDGPERNAVFAGTGVAGGVTGLLIDGDAVLDPPGIARGDGDVVGEQGAHMFGKALGEFVVDLGNLGLQHIAVWLTQHD